MAKKVLIIDGQGGNIGRQLVKLVTERFPEAELLAVGTNSIATENMLKAGARSAATGENAVIVSSKRADVIIGPIGIVIADSMLGEITPKMAAAVAQSRAKRIMIPFSNCDNYIAGVADFSTGKLLADAVAQLKTLV